MTNPFTHFLRSLRGGSEPSDIARFVAAWDKVEAIVVAVNKRGEATEEERGVYTQARAILLADYERLWADCFAPHWPHTLEAGQPPPSDPFPRILAALTADGFVKNWPAMQALAAARETLNRYVLNDG